MADHKDDKNFEEAFKRIVINEGGYVNDPDDLGGETKYGISKRSYPHLDIRNLTLDDARAVYYNDFWLKNKCNLISNFETAFKVFDLSVNMGRMQAAITLQRSLRAAGFLVLEDGIIGAKTLDAANKSGAHVLLAAMKSEAAGYYRMIAGNNISQQKFLTGWLNRAYA